MSLYKWPLYDLFGLSSAICMFILHKTEVLVVILRCLISLNLNWYKSYGKKHKKTKNTKDANVCFCTKLQKKRQLINSHFKTIYGHFFANYMFIFHKTEIQTVILRCLTIINLNCYKSYDTKHKNAKNAKNANACFCTKLQNKKKWKYLSFVS